MKTDQLVLHPGVKGKHYIKNALSPLKFKLGMLRDLPSAFFWGVKIRSIDMYSCAVELPYSWRAKNPFRSLYFAAMAGAGELSTGALCQLHLADRGKWSMLVTDFRAEYTKKATGVITFLCEDGMALHEKLVSIQSSGQPDTITMISKAVNEEGIQVATIYITWSFKKKSDS